ncbi:ferrous iron transporter B [Roseiconus nitratireducens]|uniref:Ferrous iron transporter B n=1 Tax=Roseiconus nitratireducens TaxID=2605748 RepID=A0A5M6CTB3_9BACT|nr:ferrous iron transporter B [Roseiconus nitratireducens]KAA5538548.1 ferrous iron transporter B [Roseiconus nitratireducens]
MNQPSAFAERTAASPPPPSTVLLVGNPNVGKTSLFNALAGLRAKTANYPGITVDLREAVLPVAAVDDDSRCQATSDICLIDLPGLYSLDPASPEEEIAARRISGQLGGIADCVVVVVDATNMARTLVLASEILELNLPTVVAVNLIDAAESRGIQVQTDRLSERLGCPVVAVSARTGRGLAELRESIYQVVKPTKPVLPIARASCVAGCTGCPYAARFDWADGVAGASTQQGESHGVQLEWLDRWLTSRWVGLVALLAVMFSVFFLIFSLADIPMSVIETCFGWAGDRIGDLLPHQPLNRLLWFPIAAASSLAVAAGAFKLNETRWTPVSGTLVVLVSVLIGLMPLEDFRSLVIEGVIGGIAGVVVFLPQICILFFFITLLEDSGYMARGAFVMERIMRRVGLPGKAFVPMLSAHACAIPGIMAARTIETWRDRLVTILVLPLLTCSARLPVYVMVAALLFGDSPAKAALMFAGAYLLGLIAALSTAFVLKKTVVRGEASPMILELPRYRLPSLRNAWFTMLDRAFVFLRQAGSTILLISVVLWALATYPKLPESQDYSSDLTRAQASLEYSYAGRAGRLVEPVFAPLGFDWKIDVGIISSFAAREVLVSTLSIVYGLGEEGADDARGLVETLRDQTAADGSPVFSTATCFSLLVFFVLAMQCLPTQVVTKRETGSWKWAILQFVYMTMLAYVAALVVYQTLAAAGYDQIT